MWLVLISIHIREVFCNGKKILVNMLLFIAYGMF